MRYILNGYVALTLGIFLMVTPALSHDLTSYRWKYRILLVFSPTDSNSDFEVFNQSLERQISEVKLRDLIVLRVFETPPSFIEDKPLSPGDAEKLRDRFRVRSGYFTVILIGKDGGVKMIGEDQVKLQEIFDLIDTMPMRQHEMMEKGRIQ
jgi:hypothetical protein